MLSTVKSNAARQSPVPPGAPLQRLGIDSLPPLITNDEGWESSVDGKRVWGRPSARTSTDHQQSRRISGSSPWKSTSTWFRTEEKDYLEREWTRKTPRNAAAKPHSVSRTAGSSQSAQSTPKSSDRHAGRRTDSCPSFSPRLPSSSPMLPHFSQPNHPHIGTGVQRLPSDPPSPGELMSAFPSHFLKRHPGPDFEEQEDHARPRLTSHNTFPAQPPKLAPPSTLSYYAHPAMTRNGSASHVSPLHTHIPASSSTTPSPAHILPSISHAHDTHSLPAFASLFSAGIPLVAESLSPPSHSLPPIIKSKKHRPPQSGHSPGNTHRSIPSEARLSSISIDKDVPPQSAAHHDLPLPSDDEPLTPVESPLTFQSNQRELPPTAMVADKAIEVDKPRWRPSVDWQTSTAGETEAIEDSESSDGEDPAAPSRLPTPRLVTATFDQDRDDGYDPPPAYASPPPPHIQVYGPPQPIYGPPLGSTQPIYGAPHTRHISCGQLGPRSPYPPAQSHAYEPRAMLDARGMKHFRGASDARDMQQARETAPAGPPSFSYTGSTPRPSTREERKSEALKIREWEDARVLEYQEERRAEYARTGVRPPNYHGEDEARAIEATDRARAKNETLMRKQKRIQQEDRDRAREAMEEDPRRRSFRSVVYDRDRDGSVEVVRTETETVHTQRSVEHRYYRDRDEYMASPYKRPPSHPYASNSRALHPLSPSRTSPRPYSRHGEPTTSSSYFDQQTYPPSHSYSTSRPMHMDPSSGGHRLDSNTYPPIVARDTYPRSFFYPSGSQDGRENEHERGGGGSRNRVGGQTPLIQTQSQTPTQFPPATTPMTGPARCRWSGCALEALLDAEKLTSHVAEVHVGSRQSAYRCYWDGCSCYGKQFDSRTRINRHVLNHTQWRPFRCPHQDCTHTFFEACRLEEHVRRHNNQRNWPCDVPNCNSSFTTLRDLNRHAKLHTGARPFACPHCSREFADKSNMKKHCATHLTPD